MIADQKKKPPQLGQEDRLGSSLLNAAAIGRSFRPLGFIPGAEHNLFTVTHRTTDEIKTHKNCVLSEYDNAHFRFCPEY